MRVCLCVCACACVCVCVCGQQVSSTEYLADHADRLSTRARRGLARQIAFEKDFAMPPGYYDE
jgi:hypothetical protein